MHPSLALLDQAIDMAEREFALLELEDAEGLEESAQKRLGIMDEAWAGRSGCDAGAMREKLLRLREFQGKLDSAALARYEETRDKLKERRQASRAIVGYGGSRLKRSVLPQVLVRNS